MKTYTVIPRPAGDGWDRVPALQVDTCLWLPPAPIRMEARMCYTPEALHLLLQAREPYLRAVHTSHGCMVCEDSCMEFFFCPEADDTRYFNFECNPNGQLYVGFGHDRHDSVHLLVQNEADLFHPRAGRTEDGWHLQLEIPVRFVQLFVPSFQLAPGKCLRANFYKCGDLTVQPHYYAWNPVRCSTPDFHRPEDFGRMQLV